MKKENFNGRKIMICLFLMVFIWVTMNDGWKKLFVPQEKVLTVGAFSDSYWGVENGYSYRILDEAIALFEEEHPGIRVRYESGIMKADYSEWLAEGILTGTAPDVFVISGDDMNNLSEIGALKNLTELSEEDHFYNPEVYYPSVYQYGIYNNILYALPFECAPRLMFVNKSILDAEHIPMPDKDWTWDDFYSICKRVTRDRNGNGILDQYGVAGYSWEDAFDSNAVRLFNREGTECSLTGDQVTAAIMFLEKLEKLNDGYSVKGRDFTLGNVAFQPLLFSEYRAYKSYPLSIKKYSGFDWECVTMPAGPQGDNTSRLKTLSIAMNARTIYPQESWAFMKFLTQDERVQAKIFEYSEGVSVLPAVTESDHIRDLLVEHSGESHSFPMNVLKDAIEGAVATTGFHNYELAVDAVGQVIGDITNGDKNISMELIIQNRNLNHYLQSIKQQ